MMIEQTIAHWGDIMASKDSAKLSEILADDVVFLSPVVFTPQHGKDITQLYLTGAMHTLSGSLKPDGTSCFQYTKKVLAGNQAVLEFETEIDGKYVNGVDIIECNDEGKIVEFRVMIRPLQAVNLVHQKMGEMLAQLKS
jgi:ketosteroid isomerase-like protein|tara:strand:+ start:229 stop:645 length:417 start_codon:yes stop_codon:yes gene_type:complete